ncbi:MAG: ribonuclease P protein component, partial [Xanthomonadales bacterium]|nr:ribonuclease P protein component [Xanthomonadales bacterium]
AVSRKTDPRATGRNRIKRVIRESFRNYHSGVREPGVKQRPARDYVVLALEAARFATNSELSRSLEEHWMAIDRKMESGGARPDAAKARI